MEALPDGPKNPYGNGFIPVETDLTSEAQAQRVCDPTRARLWKVKNPESLHPITGAPQPSLLLKQVIGLLFLYSQQVLIMIHIQYIIFISCFSFYVDSHYAVGHYGHSHWYTQEMLGALDCEGLSPFLFVEHMQWTRKV